MSIKALSLVVLEKDLPSHGLLKGDVGTAVEIYPPDGIEVEFVTGSGKTQALVTLKTTDLHLIGDAEILSVRRLDAA